MNFIRLFILFIGLVSFFELNAQSGVGKMHAKETSDIKFNRSYNSLDNTTRYTITKNNSEIYEINFKYDGDSILIYWIDREKIKIYSNFLKFDIGDKRILISDYQPNISGVNESNSKLILFSTEKEGYTITLYKFKPCTGCPFYFELQPVPENIQAQYQQEMSDYYKEQQNRIENEAAIAKVKTEMWNYKDSLREICLQKGENEKKKVQKAEASQQTSFTVRIDSVFKSRFENLRLFGGDDSFNVKFEFNCSENGFLSVDTTKVWMYFTDGQVRNWFRDSFNSYIRPVIDSMIFDTPEKPVISQDLIPNFESRFNQQIDDLDPGRKGDLFGDVIKQVEDSLTKYSKYDVNVATKYACEIKVKSETKFPEWRYNSVGEIFTKSEDFKQEEITEDLKQQFKALNLKTSSRYSIEYCTVSINVHKFKPHIRETNSKPF
jgi:hypothetical protein